VASSERRPQASGAIPEAAARAQEPRNFREAGITAEELVAAESAQQHLEALFLERAAEHYQVRRLAEPQIRVSWADLPREPELLVLPGR